MILCLIWHDWRDMKPGWLRPVTGSVAKLKDAVSPPWTGLLIYGVSIPSSRNELHVVRTRPRVAIFQGCLQQGLWPLLKYLNPMTEFSLNKTQPRSSLRDLRCVKEQASFTLGVIVRVLFNLRNIVPSTGTFSRWFIQFRTMRGTRVTKQHVTVSEDFNADNVRNQNGLNNFTPNFDEWTSLSECYILSYCIVYNKHFLYSVQWYMLSHCCTVCWGIQWKDYRKRSLVKLHALACAVNTSRLREHAHCKLQFHLA